LPLSSLNKIIAIILTGALFLVLLLLSADGEVLALSASIPDGFKGTAPTILLSLPVILLFGAVVDAFADLTVRELLKGGVADLRKRRVMRLLRQDKLRAAENYWGSAFEAAIEFSPKWRNANAMLKKNVGSGSREESRDTGDTYDKRSQLASAIFLKHSAKEQFEWVISHYSTFFLGTSLCVVVFVGQLLYAQKLSSALGLLYIVTSYAMLWLAFPSTLSCVARHLGEPRLAGLGRKYKIWAIRKRNLTAGIGIAIVALVGIVFFSGALVVLFLASNFTIYFLLSLSADKYLYAHVCVYRFAFLVAQEQGDLSDD